MEKSTAYICIVKIKIYDAARRLEEMQDLNDNGISIVSLDLIKSESIINSIREKVGWIDILINNSGYGSYVAVLYGKTYNGHS